MNLCFVIPRYHVPKAGGAEILVERLAGELVRAGHGVEILTTCVVDHTRWSNDLPEGTQIINNIPVHRFAVDPRVNLTRFISLQQRIDRGWPLTRKEEEAWMAGSVHSAGLYEFLRRNHPRWGAIIFAPYLFGITHRGLDIAPGKSFLIPCLHPEPYANLKIFFDMFHKPRGLLFNSEAERDLAIRLYGIAADRCRVAGMGFRDCAIPSGDHFRDTYDIGSAPFVLYAGRREKGKNTFLLIDYFLAYKKHHPGPLKLVMIGSPPLSADIARCADVMDLGYVSDAVMLEAYHSAGLVCQPSINESFAIVLMEAWLVSTPVLVNAKCPVTCDHVRRSGGGLWFSDYFEFEACVERLTSDAALARKMGDCGRRYVLSSFRWEDVLDRFLDAVRTGASC